MLAKPTSRRPHHLGDIRQRYLPFWTNAETKQGLNLPRRRPKVERGVVDPRDLVSAA
jgi:hypothetical protein